jgi:uncharacterized phage-associated protein
MTTRAAEPTREGGTSSISFRFSERKATAAALLFAELAGGEIQYLALMKLLYLADAKALTQLGRPITGDRYFSMKLGPVLSQVLNLIDNTIFNHPEKGPWSENFEAAGRYGLRVQGRVDASALSEAEAQIIAEVFRAHGHLDKWALVDLTHGLAEYKKPEGGRRPLEVEEILRVFGKSDEQIEEVRRAAEEEKYFDALFGP